MAFATSASAFGMKPANAGTNIFGNAQPQQQQTPAFGNAPPLGQIQQQQPTNMFGSFGQNTQQQQNPQQPTGTGLFGQSTQPQQQATTNIFGQSTQQPQQQQTGGLFGQPQQQPQQTTNLFGQPQQQQQQQPQQQQGSSLFGGSLFGNTASQQQPQQQQQQPQQSAFGGFGGFGATGQQQQQQQPQQGQTGTGLFGSTTTQTQPSLFGGTGTTGGFGLGSSLFGNKSQAPQQPQQQFGAPAQSTGFGGFGQTAVAQPNAPPPFTNKTKFNDLPDDVKTTLETIDSYIQGRVQIAKDLQQKKLGEGATKRREEMLALRKDVVNTTAAVRNDLHVTQDLKAKVDQAVEDTIVATRIIDGFRNPQSGNTYLKDHADFPLEYFTRVADQMKERLVWYKSTIEQIERKLASVSSSAQTPQSISLTLQAQHSTFLALASKTAAVDAELQKIKALYTQLWRSKTGSVRDPFNDVAKPAETGDDFGLGGLSVR
ncbi:hypothetical protein BDN70DRAFT_884096 [Pholiota conissans]|uniref:Uncharacterized protein n=1 Tax=Pholiota conissans TaxID=109636 RepID=A0A9P5YWC9_9AGAR|nr:hypothetical protein BDN70DRAFT_884096 [Pholiota conissans]